METAGQRAKEREEREGDIIIKRNRGVIDGGHAKEREKEREEIEREMEERNRKGERAKEEDLQTHRHTQTMNDS